MLPLIPNSFSDDAEIQFYTPKTSSLFERRPRILKHGNTFGVFDHYGDIFNKKDNSEEGLYHNDTRYLSNFQILFQDHGPLLLSSTIQNNNTMLTVDLTNPDILVDEKLYLPRDSIHIVRSKFLWQDACYERIKVQNFNNLKKRFTITLSFAGDFADIFEVRGQRRVARGQSSKQTDSNTKVSFSYEGLDSVIRKTTIEFAPKPDYLDNNSAIFKFDLEPRERSNIFFSITFDNHNHALKRQDRRFFSCLRQSQRELRQANAQTASVETSSDIFNEVLCRSITDHQMLVTETEHGSYPYAGIPWYCTAFGRDGIITAMQILWIDSNIAKGVLHFLADNQANEHIPEADAEPGKILHETRRGEMARLGEVPFRLYYGSVDATPLFVMLAGMYYERTGDLKTISDLWPNLEAALTWIDTYGDLDGDGFVEYQRQVHGGLDNQGWKDSHDSIFHADGRLAKGPIALCEVQAYVFAAKRHASVMARDLGFSVISSTLEQQAMLLREQFEATFWSDQLSTYILALDGEKKPCAVRTSNAGQVLFTGIASPERASRLADLLMGREFFNGWGIRTVAESETRYNPMSYHNGSVWPHDNALIAFGLARYGLTTHVQRLFSGLFEAAIHMDLRRLPELFCGFRRVPGKGPTFYPVACSPQAWAGAAPFSLLQACLGIEFNHQTDEIRFKHPQLPNFVDEVFIRALRIGESRMDVLIRKHESSVSITVLNQIGPGHVVIIL